MNLGIHVVRHPSGRFGFVGTLPATLAVMAEATDADVMAGRAVRTLAGIMAPRFPSFATEEEARDFAAVRGVRL